MGSRAGRKVTEGEQCTADKAHLLAAQKSFAITVACLALPPMEITNHVSPNWIGPIFRRMGRDLSFENACAREKQINNSLQRGAEATYACLIRRKKGFVL